MPKSWSLLIEKMPELLNKLQSQPLRQAKDFKDLPEKGIYVFYENDKPVYVGRTQNMKQRLRQHCLPSSGHNSATFAFIIAKRKADSAGINIKRPRKELVLDPDFTILYLKAKERVSRMHVRVLEVKDPIEQTIFEVYASLILNTREYNNFNTH
jgi:hypothetical protein